MPQSKPKYGTMIIKLHFHHKTTCRENSFVGCQQHASQTHSFAQKTIIGNYWTAKLLSSWLVNSDRNILATQTT